MDGDMQPAWEGSHCLAGLLGCFSSLWEERMDDCMGAACCIMRFCLSAWHFLFFFLCRMRDVDAGVC